MRSRDDYILNPPKDINRGFRAFEDFTQLEPNEPVCVKNTIPSTGLFLGYMTWITYDSDKWEAKAHSYIHKDDERKGGCRLVSFAGRRGDAIAIPAFIRNSAGASVPTTTLAGFGKRRGHFTGCGYIDEEGYEQELKRSLSLYFVPTRNALVALDRNHNPVLCMWGGGMHVTKRGIVG